MRRTELKNLAESKVAENLRVLKGESILRYDRPGYTRRPEDNLVRTVSKRDFWEDLIQGDGAELTELAKNQLNSVLLTRPRRWW